MDKNAAVGGPQVEIRRLEEGDEDILFHFLQSLSETTIYYFEPHPMDRDSARQLVSEVNQDKSVIRFLATIWEGSAEKAVGYAFLWKLDRDLASLGIGVSDQYQGRGLGKALMNVLLDTARDIGRKEIGLSVAEANEKAISLYQKMGFAFCEGPDARWLNESRGAYWVNMRRAL